MLVIDGNKIDVAVVDPSMEYGQTDQYVKYSGNKEDLSNIIFAARNQKKEIRYYYKGLSTEEGELISANLIITEIPSGHIQPFHTHEKIHEFTLVNKGIIVAVDSENFQEGELEEIKKQGKLLKEWDMVIEEPEVRHTILNPSDEYAILTTVQTARIPMEDFPTDWKGKKIQP